MAIIEYTKDSTLKSEYFTSFPDQFKTEKQKKNSTWIKHTMDYFRTRAYGTYMRNIQTFVKNYDLMNGILRTEDFYESDEEVKSFTEELTKDIDLPSYVKHYSIMSTPINDLIGEMSKRPNTFRVKAFDEDSLSEELEFKTDILQQYIISKAKEDILAKSKMRGEDLSPEDIEALTLEKVKDQIDTYTSVAEKWANRVLTAMEADFNLKEKSEDAFRDLSISAREYFLIDEDGSKLGFDIQTINPKNAWYLTTPDKKYTSDVTERTHGAYAAGTIEVMELSEIIESFPQITKEEIDHLRTRSGFDGGRSNLNGNVKPGIESIKYDTYDPLVEETRAIIESSLSENADSMRDFLGIAPDVSDFGDKFVVVRAYWISKKKIGKLTYLDEFDNIQSMLVDENYIEGSMDNEISIEWGWINQWYKGINIGSDIYHVSPFKLLSYCPLIGTVYNSKNSTPTSIVDLMKPFQVIYNICINQLFSLLRKEIGNIANINIRKIPRVKDGDDQDAIDVWEMEARERGVSFEDDSPENTKAPVSNTSVARNIDLTRSNEIESRYMLAVTIKNECWELIGMSKQRLGSITPSETATGTNTALQQSYAQTEPLFVAHEYVQGQLYQAILDASLYIESQKPYSTLSYITSEGSSAFVRINGNELKFRDLKVFPTNRPEDTKMFNDLRQLAQAVIQNGGSLYDIVELYSTKSIREMRRSFKELRDKNLAMEQQANELERQKIEADRAMVERQIEETRNQKQADMINENYQNELDRLNKKEIALIQASSSSKQPARSSVDTGKISSETDKITKQYELKMAEINSRNEIEREKIRVDREKLEVDKENQKNDLEVARINASNRSKKKK